jgi:cation:H+ antiporter
VEQALKLATRKLVITGSKTKGLAGGHMLPLYVALVMGLVLLIISTDQFVSGASTVAEDMDVSSVLVGAIILGCGTGLPELALAFYGSHVSPWRQVLGLHGQGGHGIGLALFFILLVFVFTIPTLFPGRIQRSSPLLLAATIAFSTLLRGSLDRVEGAAMLVGFAVGIAWIVHSDRDDPYDPFAPIVVDDYANQTRGAYIEAPVMTPVQIGITRAMFGLLGTAIGAQVLAFGSVAILKHYGGSTELRNLMFVSLGSLLPHVVVAVQALRQHHERLAIGNLIGSSLFNSLAIGGLVAIIRPYQSGGSFTPLTLGVIASTALLTWMMLHTDDDLSPKQGVILLGAYVGLIMCVVL